MGGTAIGAGRVVVGGGAHQRMAEREPVAVEADDAGSLGGLQLGHTEAALGERLDDPCQVAIGLGGGDEERRPHVGVQPFEEEVDDALTGAADRQRVGQLRPTGALVGVEEVGGLDEDEGQPAGGGDELAADRRAADPGVAQDLAGDLVGHGVDAQRRAGVGVGVGPEPSGGHDRQAFELQPAGDVRQGAPGGQVDPWQVVDDDHEWGALGGVDEQVTGGEGDGERFDGLVRRFDRQGAEDRRPPSRGEVLDPVQGAVEDPGQPGPGQLDLGLHTVETQDAAFGPVGGDQRRGFVQHRRLADPGLTDDRQRPPFTHRGPRGEGDDRIDHVLAASQRRRTVVWGDLL